MLHSAVLIPVNRDCPFSLRFSTSLLTHECDKPRVLLKCVDTLVFGPLVKAVCLSLPSCSYEPDVCSIVASNVYVQRMGMQGSK